MSEPNRYAVSVDPDGTNNAHSYLLQMAGHNKRVLELGAASGHVTQALIDAGCDVTAVEIDQDAAAGLQGIANQVLVGDLNDESFRSTITDAYDVVCAGDVLEHLPDPQAVMDWAARRLAPAGKLVVSVPNIAHIDVRLSLLQGNFRYQPTGLLDATHLRFFTIDTVHELVRDAGLAMVDLRRVRQEPFCTELPVEPEQVDPALVEAILEDPEARTYQFVFTAVRDDATHQIESLATRYLALQASAEDREIRDAGALRNCQAELDAARADVAGLRAQVESALVQSSSLLSQNADFQGQIAILEAQVHALQEHSAGLEAERAELVLSRSWRLTRPLRGASGALRSLRGR